MELEASPEHPIYRKVFDTDSRATRLFFVVCDEGNSESIVCGNMYEWAADWLVGVLGRQPYSKYRGGCV